MSGGGLFFFISFIIYCFLMYRILRRALKSFGPAMAQSFLMLARFVKRVAGGVAHPVKAAFSNFVVFAKDFIERVELETTQRQLHMLMPDREYVPVYAENHLRPRQEDSGIPRKPSFSAKTLSDVMEELVLFAVCGVCAILLRLIILFHDTWVSSLCALQKKAGPVRSPFPIYGTFWTASISICAVAFILCAHQRFADGYVSAVTALRWIGISHCVFVSLTYLLLAVFEIDIESRFRKTPTALRARFPLSGVVWFIKMSACVISFTVFMRVPDVYGFRSIFAVTRWLTIIFASFLALIYFLRAAFEFDVDMFFRDEYEYVCRRTDYSRRRRIGELTLAVLLLNFILILIYKPIYLSSILLWIVYFTLFREILPRTKDKKLTLVSLVALSGISSLFIAIIALYYFYGNKYRDVFLADSGLLTALAMIAMAVFWRRMIIIRPGDGRKMPILFHAMSLVNFLCLNPIKYIYMAAIFYFVLMMYTMFPIEFVISAAAVFVVFAYLWRRRDSIPAWLNPSLIGGYACIAWISILCVQSYNRIPPFMSSCSTIGDSKYIRSVWTRTDIRKNRFLEGALPYDTILDSDRNALFITFKNLRGHGAVLRVDPNTRKLKDHLVTVNDEIPTDMFYPERLCIDRREQKVYSSTKCRYRFQLLEMDYSGGGIRLAARHRFPGRETTNCEVDERNGDVYVIFLGPPDNHILVMDGKTKRTIRTIHFKGVTYADYFTLDTMRDRVAAPSLVPNSFGRADVHDIAHFPEKRFTHDKHALTVPIRMFGLKLEVPAPALGIDIDRRNNHYFFSLPFQTSIVETEGKTFRVIRRIATGKFPRKIAYNEKYGILFVTNYAEDTVDAINVRTWKRVHRYRVGRLARSVTVDRRTGRTFVATGCGVFELFPPDDRAKAER